MLLFFIEISATGNVKISQILKKTKKTSRSSLSLSLPSHSHLKKKCVHTYKVYRQMLMVINLVMFCDPIQSFEYYWLFILRINHPPLTIYRV